MEAQLNKKSKCKYCDEGNELIQPFWESPYHHVRFGPPTKYVTGMVKVDCGNREYDSGCPGCGGPRGHYGECK